MISSRNINCVVGKGSIGSQTYYLIQQKYTKNLVWQHITEISPAFFRSQITPLNNSIIEKKLPYIHPEYLSKEKELIKKLNEKHQIFINLPQNIYKFERFVGKAKIGSRIHFLAKWKDQTNDKASWIQGYKARRLFQNKLNSFTDQTKNVQLPFVFQGFQQHYSPDLIGDNFSDFDQQTQSQFSPDLNESKISQASQFSKISKMSNISKMSTKSKMSKKQALKAKKQQKSEFQKLVAQKIDEINSQRNKQNTSNKNEKKDEKKKTVKKQKQDQKQTEKETVAKQEHAGQNFISLMSLSQISSNNKFKPNFIDEKAQIQNDPHYKNISGVRKITTSQKRQELSKNKRNKKNQYKTEIILEDEPESTQAPQEIQQNSNIAFPPYISQDPLSSKDSKILSKKINQTLQKIKNLNMPKNSTNIFNKVSKQKEKERQPILKGKTQIGKSYIPTETEGYRNEFDSNGLNGKVSQAISSNVKLQTSVCKQVSKGVFLQGLSKQTRRKPTLSVSSRMDLSKCSFQMKNSKEQQMKEIQPSSINPKNKEPKIEKSQTNDHCIPSQPNQMIQIVLQCEDVPGPYSNGELENLYRVVIGPHPLKEQQMISKGQKVKKETRFLLTSQMQEEYPKFFVNYLETQVKKLNKKLQNFIIDIKNSN